MSETESPTPRPKPMAPKVNLLVVKPVKPPVPKMPKTVTRSGKPKMYVAPREADAINDAEVTMDKDIYDHKAVEILAVEPLPVEKPVEVRCKSCGRFLSQVSDRCTESVHKKPYVPSAHLSARPLLGNEDLKALKDKLTPVKTVKNSNSKKTQEKK